MSTKDHVSNQSLHLVVTKYYSIAIFIASSLAYIAAFAFEAGYLTSFGIDYQSAHVELTSFILVLLPTIFLALILVIIGETINDLFLKLKLSNPIHRQMRRLIKSTIIYSALVIPLIIYSQKYWTVLVLFTPMLLYLIFPFLFHPRTPGFKNKILKEEQVHKNQGYKTMTGKYIGHIALLLIAMASVFFTAGAITARDQKKFKLYQTMDESYIIVREYSGKLIAVKLNESKKIENDYLIINTDSSEKLQFENIIFAKNESPLE